MGSTSRCICNTLIWLKNLFTLDLGCRSKTVSRCGVRSWNVSRHHQAQCAVDGACLSGGDSAGASIPPPIRPFGDQLTTFGAFVLLAHSFWVGTMAIVFLGGGFLLLVPAGGLQSVDYSPGWPWWQRLVDQGWHLLSAGTHAVVWRICQLVTVYAQQHAGESPARFCPGGAGKGWRSGW